MKRGIRAAAAAAFSAVAAVAVRDLLQRDHALLRNFPVIGHGRYLIEAIGPELRQYVVAGNNEERPVHPRSAAVGVRVGEEGQNNYFGFGTDNDMEYTAGYPIIKHRTFGRAVPRSTPAAGYEAYVPCAKVLGAARGRAGAFRPAVGRQHLRHELRLAVRQRHRGAEPGRGARGLPAQHR